MSQPGGAAPQTTADVSAETAAVGAARPWFLPGVLTVAALVLIVALFHDTALSMVSIWWRSDTFAHGFVILPISAYLIWGKRRELAALTPKPMYLGLVPMLGLGLLWLLASLVDVQVIQQYSMVAMFPVVVLTLLGWRVMRTVLFPLLFLLLAVPVGEALIYPMMELTAHFTILALKLSGIPVYAEGTFITIPSGQWSVVEGCSGVRYLIASVTLGCLYAYLMYRSPMRRAIFVALSIVAPIVGNWLRAYLIVLIGHLSDMRLATGVDHIIYGWVFFGIIIGLLFFAGSFWREDVVVRPAVRDVAVGHDVAGVRIAPAFLLVLVAIAVGPALDYALNRDTGVLANSVSLSAPRATAVWQARSDADWDWRPRYIGADAELRTIFEKPESDGAVVGLFIEYYRHQRQGAELVNSQNVMVIQKHAVWRNVGERTVTTSLGARQVKVRETQLHSRQTSLLVWDWFWVDGRYTSNPYIAKLLEAKARLLGSSRSAAAIVIATPYEIQPEPAAERLQKFVNEMLPSIEATLHGASRHETRD